MAPLISVVIPTYNRGARVQATIDSALAQTLPPETYEIIIVDDGSTDDTVEFLRQTYGSNERIRIITQENQGVAAARNRGLEEARGEFIAYLDHDDRWLPEKLELQLKAFEDKPEVGVVYSSWWQADEQGVPLPEDQQLSRGANWWKPVTGNVYCWLCLPSGLGGIRSHQYLRNPIISLSVPMFRTEYVRSMGGFDPSVAPSDDWDLALRLARLYEFAYAPGELVLYVHHDAQQSRDHVRMFSSARKVLSRQLPYLFTKPKIFLSLLVILQLLKGSEAYYDAKQALFEGRKKRVMQILGGIALRSPWELFSRRCIYLIMRLIAGNTSPY